jgi:hypothetical protein
MINDGGHTGNGLGTEQGTQAEGFDIEREPLFDEPTSAARAMYDDDDGDDCDTEEKDDIAANPYAEREDVVMVGTATATHNRISKRTANYTTKEDMCLCRSWIEISQDTICGAEQKGRVYWRRVTMDFHECWLLKTFKIHSDHGQFLFKIYGPSSNLRPTSFVTPLRMSSRVPRAAPA